MDDNDEYQDYDLYEDDEIIYDELGDVIEDKKDENDETESDESDEDDILEKTNFKHKKIVPKKDRIFKNNITRFEYGRTVEILGNMINTPNFKVYPILFEIYKKITGNDLTDSLDIACFWLDNRRIAPIPFTLDRIHNDGSIEKWKYDELSTYKEITYSLKTFIYENDEILPISITDVDNQKIIYYTDELKGLNNKLI